MFENRVFYMKYWGIDYGRIIEGFTFIPTINLCWATLENKKYYDIQFVWLYWYFTIGQIHNKIKEIGF